MIPRTRSLRRRSGMTMQETLEFCYRSGQITTVQLMQFGILLAVALGGALGSLLRYFVAGAVQSAAWPGFPWGIFVVNITGGFAMGVISELAALKLSMTPEVRAFLTVGILGGYTTFSTFSLDSVLLIERGAYVERGALCFRLRDSSRFWRCSPGLWLVRAHLMTETARIAHDEDGIRVDRWFKRHYPALTHGRLEKLLRTGQVRLDGKRVKAADRVVVGPDRAPAAAGRAWRSRGKAARRKAAPGSARQPAGHDPLHGQVRHRSEQAAGSGDAGRQRADAACRRHARQSCLREEHASQARASPRPRHVGRAGHRAHRARRRRNCRARSPSAMRRRSTGR